jgi:hypothetical protein
MEAPDEPVETDAGTFYPARQASQIHRLNEEAAGWRVKYREAEAKLALAAADTTALAMVRGEVRDLKISQALTDTAIRLGANPRLTKALLQSDGLLLGLDPDKSDFAPALESMIQTAMKADPGIKGAATFMPVRSGSDISNNGTATPIGNGNVSRDMVNAARAAGDHEQVAKWQRSGALDAMLRGEV